VIDAAGGRSGLVESQPRAGYLYLGPLVPSSTCGRGGWHVFKALEALAAIRGGKRREKGKAHVSKQDMLTSEIANAPAH
jgi:hypothetical protein